MIKIGDFLVFRESIPIRFDELWLVTDARYDCAKPYVSVHCILSEKQVIYDLDLDLIVDIDRIFDKEQLELDKLYVWHIL